MYIPNGHYSYDLPTLHDNHNTNIYQPSANWANNYNQPNQSTYTYHQPLTNATNTASYNDNQCRVQTQQSQHTQQPSIATNQFLSPPYNTPYEGSHQLNINHNYMDNHLKTLSETAQQKIVDDYCQPHRQIIEQTAATAIASTDAAKLSNAIPPTNKSDNSRMNASAHRQHYANTGSTIDASPKNPAKQTHTNDSNDSPALRALLTNRKLRYSPDYSSPNMTERQKMMGNDYHQMLHHQTANASAIDTIALSPMKTEDSVDFLDEFTLYGKMAIPTPHSTGMHTAKIGYAYGGAQMRSPLAMTSENLHSAPKSPMTNYVAGISTPPLSPKEAEPVNQMRLSDTPSPDNSIQQQWLSNRCEYLIFRHFFYSIISIIFVI